MDDGLILSQKQAPWDIWWLGSKGCLTVSQGSSTIQWCHWSPSSVRSLLGSRCSCKMWGHWTLPQQTKEHLHVLGRRLLLLYQRIWSVRNYIELHKLSEANTGRTHPAPLLLSVFTWLALLIGLVVIFCLFFLLALCIITFFSGTDWAWVHWLLTLPSQAISLQQEVAHLNQRPYNQRCLVGKPACVFCFLSLSPVCREKT